eukprot:3738841-Rhodomonas_salina.1
MAQRGRRQQQQQQQQQQQHRTCADGEHADGGVGRAGGGLGADEHQARAPAELEAREDGLGVETREEEDDDGAGAVVERRRRPQRLCPQRALGCREQLPRRDAAITHQATHATLSQSRRTPRSVSATVEHAPVACCARGERGRAPKGALVRGSLQLLRATCYLSTAFLRLTPCQYHTPRATRHAGTYSPRAIRHASKARGGE